MHCVSFWGLCRPYYNMAKLPLEHSGALVQHKQGPKCQTGTGHGLWAVVVVGPAGASEPDMQVSSAPESTGEVSMCAAACLEGFITEFLASSRCPKAL